MGIVAGGGHAEYVCVHEREAIRVPHNLSWEEAAAVPEVFLTAYDALFRQMDVQMGERLLIHAVGSGVGTAAVQLAQRRGGHHPGHLAHRAEAAARARAGAGRGHRRRREDWAGRVDRPPTGEGVNAILDLVGGGYLAEQPARAGRRAGAGDRGGHRRPARGPSSTWACSCGKRLHLFGTVLRAARWRRRSRWRATSRTRCSRCSPPGASAPWWTRCSPSPRSGGPPAPGGEPHLREGGAELVSRAPGRRARRAHLVAAEAPREPPDPVDR